MVLESFPRTMLQLFLLSSATFIFVTFEMYPVGLILDMADDLGVSEGRVGLLVSGYAVISACVTIPSVALAGRLSRRRALLLSLGALLASELITAVAVSYQLLVVSRVLAAVMHGLFWSLIPAIAAVLVPAQRLGRATAAVFTGASVALVAGSPSTTLVGHLIGWRQTALLLAGWTAAVIVGLWRVLHGVEHRGSGGDVGRDARPPGEESRVGTRPQWRLVAVICVLCLIQMTAHFTSYTYIAVIVTSVLHGQGLLVTALTAFGVAGAMGTVLVGQFSDRYSQRTAMTAVTLFAVSMLLLVAMPEGVRVAAVLTAMALWGGSYGASGPTFQTAITRVAGDWQEQASAVYVTCFQIGIAAGSAFGATLLAGWSARALPVVSFALGIVVLAGVFVFRRAYANTTVTPEVPAATASERCGR